MTPVERIRKVQDEQGLEDDTLLGLLLDFATDKIASQIERIGRDLDARDREDD